MTTTTTSTETFQRRTAIARTILGQLGHGALFMLGNAGTRERHGHTDSDGRHGVEIRIRGMAPRAGNTLRIVLDEGSDTYRVELWHLGRRSALRAEVSDVYVDALHSTIESLTGLRTSL